MANTYEKGVDGAGNEIVTVNGKQAYIVTVLETNVASAKVRKIKNAADNAERAAKETIRDQESIDSIQVIIDGYNSVK